MFLPSSGAAYIVNNARHAIVEIASVPNVLMEWNVHCVWTDGAVSVYYGSSIG